MVLQQKLPFNVRTAETVCDVEKLCIYEPGAICLPIEMSLQDTSGSPPSTCFRLKSQRSSWLGFDASGHAAFLNEKNKSVVFFLLPCKDGRYMLQLLSTSLIELQQSFDFPLLSLICSSPPKENGAWQGYGELTHSGCWFFCKQERNMIVSQYKWEHHEDYCFSLELDDYGCVAFSCGLSQKKYWTLDSSCKFLFGAQSIGKRETFQLHEYDHSMGVEKTSLAPVRINLKAHTGKYLCCAATVIGATAEAPCCCEEFLLDVNFPPSLPYWRSSDSTPVSECDVQTIRKTFYTVSSSDSRIRTGNGMLNLSAGADGKLITLQHDEAQGHEYFTVEVLPHRHRSMVSISHHSSEAFSDHLGYVSVEPSSRVNCNKLQKGKWDEFDLELANESRFLVQSVHGFFVGSQEASMHINASSLPRYSEKSCTYEISPSSNVMAWRLRAHGDSCYTLIAATCPSNRGDFYLYVDGRGKAMQSNEPGAHFPSLASLFEIKPVSRGSLIGGSSRIDEYSGVKNAIIGFTIKTVRKINGKQRYFSAEPNGTLRVSSVRVSRWEIFRLLDVDGTACAILPNEFSCVPAALNARMPTSSINPIQIGAVVVQRMVSSPLCQGLTRREFKSSNRLSGRPIQSVASIKKASQVAALATRVGQCTPARMPASLQELCIDQLCMQVSAETMNLEDKMHLISWGTECLVDTCLNVPDDLCTKIVSRWCSRQHPESSCKSFSSSSVSSLSYNNGVDNGVRGVSNVSEYSHWESSDEGLYCHSCNRKGILKMSPTVNPAHHRYLEVQYHAQNGMAQPTGFLWNLISFAGVSIMSTALLCHFFGGSNKARRSSKHVE